MACTIEITSYTFFLSCTGFELFLNTYSREPIWFLATNRDEGSTELWALGVHVVYSRKGYGKGVKCFAAKICEPLDSERAEDSPLGRLSPFMYLCCCSGRYWAEVACDQGRSEYFVEAKWNGRNQCLTVHR